MWFPENGLPIQVKVAIEIFLDEKSLGFADPPNGLYNGKTWWNLNPMGGMTGWFELPKDVIGKSGVIEVRINVKIRELNGKENEYLPVGYVYIKESNSWFFEPGESLHISKKPYQFIGWENLPK